MRKGYKFKVKFLEEILGVMDQYGYSIEFPFENLGEHTGINYIGPKGGHDYIPFSDLITDLVKLENEDFEQHITKEKK